MIRADSASRLMLFSGDPIHAIAIAQAAATQDAGRCMVAMRSATGANARHQDNAVSPFSWAWRTKPARLRRTQRPHLA